MWLSKFSTTGENTNLAEREHKDESVESTVRRVDIDAGHNIVSVL
jgi:hypothetical protein